MLMGFFPLPCLVAKDLMEVKIMIRGDQKSTRNLFEWKKSILNLSGTHYYDPSMPWVYKVGLNNKIATYLVFYIDDGRRTTCLAKAGWRASQRVYQMISYLGIQKIYRKINTPSQELVE